MRIAVVGCGALGSYYGARLAQSGNELHFLLRSDYDAVRQHGLQILSSKGDFRIRPHCAVRPTEIGPVDLVLIGLKTTANHLFPSLIPPLLHADTAVLTLQNGLGNEEALASLFGPERVFGGLCFVCLNRVQPGIVRHIAYGKIVLGALLQSRTAAARSLADLFQAAAVPCEPAPDLELAHWDKLVWNIPFNGLGVAAAAGFDAVCHGRLDPARPLGHCLTTDQLLGDPRWETFVRDLMREVIAAARAKGLPLAFERAEIQISRTRTMGPYKASTLLDFERGLPLELESLFLEPLRQAHAAGSPAPRLRALSAILGELDGSRAST